jgi:hypothetical protein
VAWSGIRLSGPYEMKQDAMVGLDVWNRAAWYEMRLYCIVWSETVWFEMRNSGMN